MTYLVGIPILAFAAVLQSTVLSRLHLFGGTLDLVLLISLSWTLSGEWQGGVIWGFVGGLCLDLLSGGPLGPATLGLVLMTYLASLSEGRFWRSHILLPLTTVLLGSLGFHGINLLTLSLTGHLIDFSDALARITLPSVFVNMLFALPIYHAIRWLHAFVYPPPVTI